MENAKTENNPTTYIVKESRAAMPASCWGRYVRVAVLEVEAGVTDVAMISERARGVVRVVRTWERRFDGLTSSCAAGRAREAARALVESLTAATGPASAAALR